MFLLDTNIVSELRRVRPHGAVLQWFSGLKDAEINFSAVTLGEIQAGIEITRTADPAKALEIEMWLDQISATRNILPVTGEIFRLWAKMMHGQSDALYEDAMIAATARVHHLTIATRNVRDFVAFDVAILNPFDGQIPS